MSRKMVLERFGRKLHSIDQQRHEAARRDAGDEQEGVVATATAQSAVADFLGRAAPEKPFLQTRLFDSGDAHRVALPRLHGRQAAQLGEHRLDVSLR